MSALINKADDAISSGVRNGKDSTEWRDVTFGEIFDISSSKRVHEAQWTTSGVPFYRAREIVKLAAQGYVENELFISEEMYADYSQKYGAPRAGDLMISAVGTLGACYVVKPEDRFYYKDASVLWFRPKRPICSGFIQHAFRTRQILDQVHAGSGSTVGTYTVVRAKETRLRLPPLDEQRRIAEVLDRADALRAKRRAALAELDTLTQSIFLDLFDDPVTNSRKWPRVPLVGVCGSADDIKCGPFGTQLSRDEFRAEGIPLWGIKNVNKFFELPTHEFLEARTASRLMQYSIEPGDIVMTRKGTVGNCAVYPDAFPIGIMHSDLLRLRVDRAKCQPIFLAHQLHFSRDVERQLALISGGAVMPGINVTRLKGLEVLVPPVEIQEEFARRSAAVEKLRKSHRSSLAELDALFASLQHRAFRGEL